MTHDRDTEFSTGPESDTNAISPLPGEPGIPNVAARQRIALSKKGLLAVALLIGSLVAVLAFTIQRVSASGKRADDAESKLVRDKPTAATAEPRKLEMPLAPAASAAMAGAPGASRACAARPSRQWACRAPASTPRRRPSCRWPRHAGS